jgi:ATP-dependent DNA helicase RecG
MTARRRTVPISSDLADVDNQPCRDATLDDLDPELIDSYRSEVRQRRLDLEPAGLSTPALLTRIGAVVQINETLVPTLTGVLFFGRAPQHFYPSLTITFLHLAGTTTGPADLDGPLYLDNREFRGPIPAVIEAARAAVLQRIGRRAIVTGFRRQEVPDYPEVAVREAIINAIAHRDYRRSGSFIQIRLFADRLEVQSPGGLAAGLTVENLVYEQHTRNPRIMRLLEDLGYVERRGVGIDTMIAAMDLAGLPPPEFEDRRTSFWVILRGPTATRSIAEYIRMGLNERQIRAIDVLHERGRMTNRDYQELFQVSERTALYDLSGLVEKGIALPVSSGRGRYYILRD